MKYQKITTGASLAGLITCLLPLVSSGDYSLAPFSDQVLSYLGVPSDSLFLFFIILYGAFVVTLFLSLITSKSVGFNKIKLVGIILLNIYAIFVQTSIINVLLNGSGSIGIGGILYYLSAVANIYASIMLFKKGGLNINKEELMKVAEKGITIGKATASVATKVAKTAVSEVKKEIDNHKSDSNQ